jgi:methylthioribose-1-phosphate isomerase
MKVNGTPMRSIWPVGEAAVGVIDQTRLPHRFETRLLESAAAVEHAIRTMVVRGAPLIGVAGAYGLALALRADPSDAALAAARAQLLAARPTAVNLRWALERLYADVAALAPGDQHPRRGTRPAASPRKTCNLIVPSAGTVQRCCARCTRGWRARSMC